MGAWEGRSHFFGEKAKGNSERGPKLWNFTLGGTPVRGDRNMDIPMLL